MTKLELLRDLLKSNLDEINKKLGAELSIYYEEGGVNFIILDCNKEVLMIEDIFIYDYTLDGQIKFIKDVVNKITTFFREADEMEYDKVYFCGYEDSCYENIYCINPIKTFNDFMFPAYSIEYDKNKLTDEILYKLIDELSWTVQVGYDDKFIYVNIDIDEVILDVKYENKKNNEISKHPLVVYYSFFEEEEAEKAVKYIKELLQK